MEKEIEQKIEKIIRELIILGYEMGRKQHDRPYVYTCDTDKGKKYWKKIKLILETQQNKHNNTLENAATMADEDFTTKEISDYLRSRKIGGKNIWRR